MTERTSKEKTEHYVAEALEVAEVHAKQNPGGEAIFPIADNTKIASTKSGSDGKTSVTVVRP